MSDIKLSGWNSISTRPYDGQVIVYLFEPFMQLHVGKYIAEDDSVINLGRRGGFTTVLPEVPYWMPADVGNDYEQQTCNA